LEISREKRRRLEVGRGPLLYIYKRVNAIVVVIASLSHSFAAGVHSEKQLDFSEHRPAVRHLLYSYPSLPHYLTILTTKTPPVSPGRGLQRSFI
jgi:hypothetical protein